MIDWNRLHPSILAASSRLTGILSKKLLAMIVQNATTVAMYMVLSDMWLSTSLSLENIMKRGTISMNDGTVWVKYMRISIFPLSFWALSLERANPLHIATAIAPTDATSVTLREFRK